jgi:hypothetical protein
VLEPDPRFTRIARCSDVALLEPVTRAAVAAIIAGAANLGYTLIPFETFRSQGRQQQLYAAGATQLRTVGVHGYGLACDLVKSIAGEPSWKGDFTFLGELAKEHGLIWGGDWGEPGVAHDFIDACHVQRCAMADQSGLFAGVWYPDAKYDPSV